MRPPYLHDILDVGVRGAALHQLFRTAEGRPVQPAVHVHSNCAACIRQKKITSKFLSLLYQ
jgi:hypothetical protein